MSEALDRPSEYKEQITSSSGTGVIESFREVRNQEIRKEALGL